MRAAWAAWVLAAALAAAGVPAAGAAGLGLPFPEAAVTPGATDADGFATGDARLCVSRPQPACFLMPPASSTSAPGVVYHFALKPRLRRLPLPGGGSLMLFSATYYAGGSGTLDAIAILDYRLRNGRATIVNLLPAVSATNVSDWDAWTLPGRPTYPVLVVADFIWGSTEEHFSPHFFLVSGWRWDARSGRYRQVFRYRTASRYSGQGRISVLAPERQRILEHFAQAR
jgi:hypothetical protein